MYNVIAKSGHRISCINERLDRQAFDRLADNGLFIQVCDASIVVTDNLPLACKQYLIGAGIAVAVQALILTLIL